MNIENTSKLILIIDDEPDIRQLLKIRLEMSKFKVIEAENGLTGVLMAKEQLPDLIITDYSMPEMNGLEVVKDLRNDPRTKDIPVLMLSSYTFGKSQIEEFFSNGLKDLMMKPYEFDLLFEKIYRFLMLKDMEAAIREEYSTSPERRRYTRFSSMNFADVEIDGKTFQAQVKNISKTGMTLILPETAIIGSTVKITLKKTESEYTGIAKIVWIDKGNVNENFIAGLEVQTVFI